MLRLEEPASTEPVSVEEVKRRLRIDHAALDVDLPGMITAAREQVEQQTGYALADAVWAWQPPTAALEPLPIAPGTIESEDGALPVVFKAAPGPAPRALCQAIILLVGDMVANTEAATEKQLFENPAVQNLIFPFRRVLP